MKLLLDLGNTRLKWQVYEDANNQASGACLHGDALGLCDIWRDLPLQGVWLAAVGQSALTEQLCAQLRSCGHIVHVVNSCAQQAGVSNAYAEPDKLGVDRWLGLLAAGHYIDEACLVVDAGTAMTLDVLAANGAHQGGLILPGLAMMRASLHANTQLLPAVQGEQWSLGVNTEQCIAGGTLGALVSTVQSVYADAAEQWGDLCCVITGGDAELVYNALPVALQQRCRIDADWLFKGLLVAACEMDK